MHRVKRLMAVMLVTIALMQPAGVHSFQSPVETSTALISPIAAPTPTASTPLGESAPGVSPFVWIIAGFILGGAIVFFAQRASPHER